VVRRAKPGDVDAICGGLPQSWLGVSWGDVPTWLVGDRASGKGRGFLLYRKPHKTAIDPNSGELYDDLLVIRTANAEDKRVLVESAGPFFTIDHFRGYNAVLIQQSRLREIGQDELTEVITDAWRAVAPAALRRAHPSV